MKDTVCHVPSHALSFVFLNHGNFQKILEQNICGTFLSTFVEMTITRVLFVSEDTILAK